MKTELMLKHWLLARLGRRVLRLDRLELTDSNASGSDPNSGKGIS